MGSNVSENGCLVIARDSDKDIKMRGLDVYVDDQFAVDLAFEGVYKVDLAAGSHSVKVTNHLYTRKLDIEMKPGETVTVQAGNTFTVVGGVMMASLGMGPYKVFLHEVGRDQ